MKAIVKGGSSLCWLLFGLRADSDRRCDQTCCRSTAAAGRPRAN